MTRDINTSQTPDIIKRDYAAPHTPRVIVSLSPLKQRHKNRHTNRGHERQGTGPLLGPGVGVSCYLKLNDHRTIIKIYV